MKVRDTSLVPSGIDKVIIAYVHKNVPDLEFKNKSIIIQALRHNYAYKGLIYKKIKNYATLELKDLYNVFIANNRHRFTDYENESKFFPHLPHLSSLKKKYNDHKYARKVFQKYFIEIVTNKV